MAYWVFRLAEKEATAKDTEDDTFDAFVALGGSSDKDSYINSDLLIKIIKEEFKMTIDIVALIKEIDEVRKVMTLRNLRELKSKIGR